MKRHRLATAENTINLRIKILRMKAQGHSFRWIARDMDLSRTYVHKLYWFALNELKKEQNEEASVTRAKELLKIDELEVAQWQKLRMGSKTAEAYILRLMAARSRYLGLDAPTRIDAGVTTYDGNLKEAMDRIQKVEKEVEKDE